MSVHMTPGPEGLPGRLRVEGPSVVVELDGRRQVLVEGDLIPAGSVLVGRVDGRPLGEDE